MEIFVPVKDMVITGIEMPTEAESLAVEHFNKEIQRMTGKALPVIWGMDLKDRSVIKVGNRSTLPALFKKYDASFKSDDADIANQSYVIDLIKGPKPTIVAAGFRAGRKPRNSLGMSYALGDLVRKLDVRDGKWGFVLSDEAQISSPKMPNRTLYLMNSYNFNPGLSLEYFTDSQIDEYVDMLIDARYSRVSLWQWAVIYLYPGNNDRDRSKNEMIHRTMRRVFDRARSRGLEVYHQLAPAHINLDLLPNEPRFTSTGYYGRTGVCWSQPEGRDLARKMAQTEMEYYGPVDGYIVWFYDPAGCFCKDCKPNQAEKLFDQLNTVVDLAKNISPNAKFEAVLWPTWVFSQTKTIGYTQDEVKSFVGDFLKLCLDKFGSRNFTIVDTCESDTSNIYNGWVNPEDFNRNAFMYSALGMASEQAYPFAGFRFGYLNEQMGKARDRGLEEANLFLQYAETNRPGVFAFADTLYESKSDWKQTAERYASSVAKGDAKKAYADLIIAMDSLSTSTSYAEMESAVTRVEDAWKKLEKNKLFFGNKDWLRGYVSVQRWYLKLAQAKNDEEFKKLLDGFKADVGSIPMYKDFMTNSMTPALCTNLHLKWYWRGPVNDDSMVGVFDK
ncbi:MAG: hypothetical protein ACYC27_07695 [Armatimonadota bacterium]